MQPTPSNERYEALDILRGFALLGVMISNMAYHSGYWFLSPDQQQELGNADLGNGTLWLIHFFTEGKFYSIFSLLFGIGFGLQIERYMQHSKPFMGRFSRRLAVLLIIGVLHALLLFVGDILIIYAFLGFALLQFKNVKQKSLLWLAFSLPLVPVIQYSITWYIAQGNPPITDNPNAEMFAQILLTYQSGSFGEIFFTNLFGYVFGRVPDLLFTGRFFKVLALFLLGFYLAKGKWLTDIQQRQKQLKKILFWGLAIGIPCNLILAHVMETDAYYSLAPSGIVEPIVYAFGVPALGLAYACMVVLAYQGTRLRQALKVLAPLGRMALTNYLFQSLICCLLFQSYGFGLFGVVNPLFFTLIGLSILIIQIIYSNWWLSKYQYGPAEWLWRSLTYGRQQAMKSLPDLRTSQMNMSGLDKTHRE